MIVRLEGHGSGHHNMAADLTMLDAAAPAARLYGWRPWCVSLGSGQRAEHTIDAAVAREHGMDVVERPTGGGAILHDTTEITYAIVLPWDAPGLPRELGPSYKVLAAPVLQVLQDAGYAAEWVEGRGGKDPFCYVREAGVSVGIRGRKVSGGAQRRTRAAVLQHGTIVLNHDPALLARLFRTPAPEVAARVTSLAAEGPRPDRAALIARLQASFEAAFPEAIHCR